VSSQERAVVRELHGVVRVQALESGGERHLPEAAVVTIGLAVGGAVHELVFAAVRREAVEQAARELLAAVEQPLEGDRARDGAVVEEERQREAVRAAPEIGMARVHAAVDVAPFVATDWPHAPRLRRRQDGELDSRFRQYLERLRVHRRLRQPHAFRVAAEACAEVVDAPAHLRDFVAPARERHDHVVVDLRDGVAVAVVRRHAGAVRFDDLAVHGGRVAIEPGGERGADVERDLLEVVDDVEDAVVVVHAPRRRVGRVTLRGDALVPVVVRRRRVLHLDRFQPRIFARRLVEMPVNRNEPPRRHVFLLQGAENAHLRRWLVAHSLRRRRPTSRS
jgi:hypothetical protein